MYRWQHKYTDYNGNEREEVFYFNFSKGEIAEWEWRTPGGLEQYFKTIMSLMDGQQLADTFCKLIDKSYGVKTPDGRGFIKTQEVLDNFRFTEAYSDLKIALATDSTFAAEFVNGIFPKEAVEAARKQKEMAEKAGISLVPPAPASTPVQAQPVPTVEGQVSYAQPASAIPLVEGQVIMPPTT